MWRSVVVARAAVLSRQGGAVWKRFYATQNPKHEVPASFSSSITQTQTQTTESEFPVFSTNWGFPKRLFISQNPRFYSQTSVGFVENGDTQLENSEIHGVSEQGLVGIDENRDTQLDSFVPGDGDEIFGVSGDAQFDTLASGEENGDEEEEVYEINLEQLENVLSLLQSSVDGSLESALDDMGLTLHEEFVVKVLETPLVLGENLIRFFKWGLKKKSEFKVTTCVVDALVRAISREREWCVECGDSQSVDSFVIEIGKREGELGGI
nr:pentatricopeptide repeat-containing protein, mitochondrial [Quercus suber]